VKHLHEGQTTVAGVLEWLESEPLQSLQWDQLNEFADWLNSEAVVAGGIGPREAQRIWPRHLADSLAFARGWSGANPPLRLLDIGAGVGLPGIPLAILWPGTRVTLLERSGRRVDLARRAVRRLRLVNVEVRQGDVVAEQAAWPSVVCRAVFPPEKAAAVVEGLVEENGTGVVGLRGESNRQSIEAGISARFPARLVEVPETVLDGAVSLLIIGASEH
jgi:16S rRNA (guanine527-N7)-methyltransferase